MFNKFRSLGAVLLVLLFLTSCNPIPPVVEVPGGQGSADPVELTLWLWPGTGLEELIRQYDEADDAVRINIVTVQYEFVHDNLQNALAAGYGAPDICLIEISFMETFKALSNQFYNLGDFGASQLESTYLDWKWSQATDSSGKMIFGLPTDIGPMVMAYRPDIFAKAGLPTGREEVRQLLSTWDDFLEAGIQVRERTGVAMIDTINMLYRFRLGQERQQYYDKETGQIIVDTNPAVKRAWDYAVKASELKLSAGAQTWSVAWGEGIKNGDFAVIFAAAWLLDNIKQTAPDSAGQWDVTALPEGSGNWGGSFLTLPKQGRNPEAAFDLIRWLTDPEQQLRLFNQSSNFPSTPGIYDTDSIRDKRDPYFSNAPVGQLLAEAARRVPQVYEGPKQHTITSVMEDAIFKVERGEATSEKAWKEAMDLVNKTIKRGGRIEHSTGR